MRGYLCRCNWIDLSKRVRVRACELVCGSNIATHEVDYKTDLREQANACGHAFVFLYMRVHMRVCTRVCRRVYAYVSMGACARACV